MDKLSTLILLFTTLYFTNTFAYTAQQPKSFELVLIIGEFGTGNGQFRYVEDFAFTGKGQLLATDAVNATIQSFDAQTGKYIKKFGGKGDSNGLFNKPEGIAIASNGDIYVADYASGYIQHFDENFKHLNTFSDLGEAPGETLEAEFMSIYDNKLLLADAGNHRIDVFALTGKFLYSFDGENTIAGKLHRPEAAKVDSKGNIWVTDLGNNRIIIYDIKGNLLRQFGKRGNKIGQFDKPTGLALDKQDNVYIGEAHNDRVQMFDKDFNFILKLGKHGSNPGEFKNIHGIAIDHRGYLYVADTGNNRIQVFKPVFN